jgi:hypothetical protein
VVTERGTTAHFAAFWDDGNAAPDGAAAASETSESNASSSAPVAAEAPVTPPAPACDPADLERIRKLEVGHWLELIGEDGQPQPAKLSWVSPISNRLLFVNRRGMRVCALTAEELAVMLGEGKVSLREIDTALPSAP